MAFTDGAQDEPKKPAGTPPPESATPEDDKPVGPSPVDRRAAVMASIDSARREMFAENGVDIPVPETEPPAEADEPGEEPGEEAAAGEEPPAAPAEGAGDEPPAQETPPAQPGEPLVTVTDPGGGERQVPLSELTRDYETNREASRRMELANETLARAEELQRRLLEGDPRLQPSDAERTGGERAPGAQPGGEDPLRDINWTGLANDLQFATPEDAGAKLKDTIEQIIASGAAPAATTPDELIQTVTDRVEWADSLRLWNAQNQDISNDPFMTDVAGKLFQSFWAQMCDHARQNNQPRPAYAPILDAAGKAARAWLQDKTGSTTNAGDGGDGGADETSNTGNNSSGSETPSVAIDANRAERKRAAGQPPEPRQPQPQSRRETSRPNPEQARVQNQRDAIQEMAKARHQA